MAQRARSRTHAAATQAQRDSQHQDDEVDALLQHLLTSPDGGHRVDGDAQAPAPAALGSQELRSQRLRDELAAFAAEHELYSQQEIKELHDQFMENMLEEERCAAGPVRLASGRADAS